MKVILQRVKEASVKVNNEIVGEIGLGYLALLGVAETDTEEICDKMVEKIHKLRIFEDENGKTNLSADDVSAEILVVSQFTLYANCKKGNRPSFNGGAKPDHANALYEYSLTKFGEYFKKVEHGIFGEDMKVSLINDGPFTIPLDSDELFV